MDQALAMRFGTNGAGEHQKVAAAQLLADIKSGKVDLDTISEEKLAHYTQLVTDFAMSDPAFAAEATKTAGANPFMGDQATIDQATAIGKIAAHAHWNELQSINQDAQVKEAAADLEKISGAQWAEWIRTGQVDTSKLSPEASQFVLQKIAAEGGESTRKIDLGNTKNMKSPLSAGDIVEDLTARHKAPTPGQLYGNIPASEGFEAIPGYGIEEADEVAKDKGMMQKLKGFFTSAGKKVHDTAGYIGGKAGLSGAGGKALGYGAMGLPLLALGGLGGYALSGDKTASAHGIEKVASAITGAEEHIKTAASLWTLAFNEGFPIHTLNSDELRKVASVFYVANTNAVVENVLQKTAHQIPHIAQFGNLTQPQAEELGAAVDQIMAKVAYGFYPEESEAMAEGLKELVESDKTKSIGDRAAAIYAAAKDYAARAGRSIGDAAQTAAGWVGDAAKTTGGKIHGAAETLGGHLGGGAARGYGAAAAIPVAAGGGLLLHHAMSDKTASANEDKDETVVKVAQAILLMNGHSEGVSQYDASQIVKEAQELLQQKGWKIQ